MQTATTFAAAPEGASVGGASPGEAAPLPLEVHQIRDLAAVLRREADGLRALGRTISGYALTVDWDSSSARACLGELTYLNGRLAEYAGSHEVAAQLVTLHADRVEAMTSHLIHALLDPVLAV